MRILSWRLCAGLTLVAGLCVFASCDDSGVQPSASKTQAQGTVRGVVEFWVGDFMCCPIRGDIVPVPRELRIHAPTTQADVDGSGTFNDGIHTELIAVVESACETGYFEFRLPAGTYSVFVVEDVAQGVFYANAFGSVWINPVEVLPDTTVDFKIRITYATSS